MNLTEQLRDIRGLDDISWWPLAPGWWILVGLLIFILLVIGVLLYRRRFKSKWQGDWRQAAREEWLALHPAHASLREQITFLSILLRRVAIQRHGREACAGLSGERWLTWLTEHDPRRFNWNQTGRLLIEIPYMPPDAWIDENQVDILYRAVRAWIDEPL